MRRVIAALAILLTATAIAQTTPEPCSGVDQNKIRAMVQAQGSKIIETLVVPGRVLDVKTGKYLSDVYIMIIGDKIVGVNGTGCGLPGGIPGAPPPTIIR